MTEGICPSIGVAMWTQGLSLFAAGFFETKMWAQAFLDLATQDPYSYQIWGRALLLAAGVVLILISNNLTLKQRLQFLGAYAVLLLLPTTFSIISNKVNLIRTGLHQRLFFAPNALLAFLMIANIQRIRLKNPNDILHSLTTLLCIALLCTALFWGLQHFWEPWNHVEYWPDWTAEVAAWRQDPGYMLNIPPQGWQISLTPH